MNYMKNSGITMTYYDYLAAVFEQRVAYPDWRDGQAMFNTLHTMDQELARQIGGTELDPFYAENHDPVIPLFLQWLHGRLEEVVVS